MEFVHDIRTVLRRRRSDNAGLDAREAQRLWGAILDEALDAVEVGAILGALAATGETFDELLGLQRAVHERMRRWQPALDARAVAIAAYGGLGGEAAIVALTAMLLRRFGVPVILHGPLESGCGLSAACVLRKLGVPPSGSLAHAEALLGESRIAYVPVQLFAPRFAWMLAARARLGVDNAAHAVGPTLDPLRGAAARVILAAGADESVEALAENTPGDFVSLRWREAAEATLARRPGIACVRESGRLTLFEADAQDMRSATALPPPDAEGTARWIERVVAGAAPVPVAALAIVAACLYAVGRASGLNEAKAMAAYHAARLAA
jgi:anthranilate phosphoribosyltransferase